MSEKKPEVMLELSVERDGKTVVIPLSETFIKRNESKKGVVYPSPAKSFVKEHFSDILVWLGEKRIASIVASRVKQLSQGWYAEAGGEDDNGKPTPELFNLDKFRELALAVDSRGESKAELEEEKAELMEELLALLEGDITENMERITEIKARSKEINEALEQKKRTPKAGSAPATPAQEVPAAV